MLVPIALTFEAGGDPNVSASMLDILKTHNVTSTIFLYGSWAQMNPDLVKRMSTEGHELGNHTYNHLNLTKLDKSAIREELRRTDEVARQLTGKPAHPWLRPPYSAVDERVEAIVNTDGYRIVCRDAIDGRNWPEDANPTTVFERTLQNAADNTIFTYHLSSPITLKVLPKILTSLQNTGYTLVSLSQLMPLDNVTNSE